jgi:hypothetical protein
MGNLEDDAGKLLQEADRARRAIDKRDWAAVRAALESIKWLELDAMIAEARGRESGREAAERLVRDDRAIADAWREAGEGEGRPRPA